MFRQVVFWFEFQKQWWSERGQSFRHLFGVDARPVIFDLEVLIRGTSEFMTGWFYHSGLHVDIYLQSWESISLAQRGTESLLASLERLEFLLVLALFGIIEGLDWVVDEGAKAWERPLYLRCQTLNKPNLGSLKVPHLILIELHEVHHLLFLYLLLIYRLHHALHCLHLHITFYYHPLLPIEVITPNQQIIWLRNLITVSSC